MGLAIILILANFITANRLVQLTRWLEHKINDRKKLLTHHIVVQPTLIRCSTSMDDSVEL